MRRRRLSGRHQVTTDGRHLVDGVAFGRPWLRAPANRPGLDLPPRKRARLTYRSSGDHNVDGLSDNGPSEDNDDYSAVRAIDTSEEEQLLLEAPGDKNGPGTVVGEGIVDEGGPETEDPAALEDVREAVSRADSPPLPAYPGAGGKPDARPLTLSSILETLKPAPSKPAAKKEAASDSSSSETSSEDSDDSSDSDSDSSSDTDTSSSDDSDSDSGRDVGASHDAKGGKSPRGRQVKPKSATGTSRDVAGGTESDSESTSSPSEEDVKKAGASGSDDSSDSSSSSDSDSSDSSDSSDDEAQQPAKATSKQKPATSNQPAVNTQETNGDLPTAARQSPPADTGTPMTRTQKRNARRRALKLHENERQAATGAQGNAGPETTAGTKTQDDELTKRRQALLESLDAGASPAATPKKRKAGDEEKESGTLDATSAPPSAQGSTASQRKMRFDLGAGRRLLFGALGLASKDEEGQQPEAEVQDALPNGHGEQDDAEADPDAWKDKIIYRAVECVREGVELSEPPFPFVQRWDPQQRVDVWFGNGKRGGKGKRKQRDQPHYYEEAPSQGKRRKTSPWPEALDYDEGAEGGLDPNEPESEDRRPVEAHTPEDLPSLPEDITTLAPLTQGEAAPGMVVTWKQWLLSKATNWQPQIGNVTGVIVRLEGDALHVLLAKRDRNLDRNEKEYDPTTGQRVYGGFEAPDLDEEEEDEGEDDGARVVAFAEMMEPRVVRGSSGAQALPGGFEAPGDDSVPIPESVPQDAQEEPSEPLSMDLQVPLSDPANDSDASRGRAARKQNTSLEVLEAPSAVSSFASGRRQPDPNSLGVSFDLDVPIPDSPTGSSFAKAKGPSNGSSKGKDASVVGELSSVGGAGIKPAGEPGSFFEAGNEYLPPNLRRDDTAAIKKESSQRAEVIDLKKESSPPRLIFPPSSPPWLGSQSQSQSQSRDENGARGKGKKRGRKRRRSSSPFEVPAGSQVIDLLSDGEGEGESVGFDSPVASQKSRAGTPSSQRNGRTSASQKGKSVGGQKGPLPKGPGRVKKGKRGGRGEVAI